MRSPSDGSKQRASEGILNSIDAILAASDPSLGTFSPSEHSRTSPSNNNNSKKGLSLSNHSKGLSISSNHSKLGSTHSRDISSHSRTCLDKSSDHSIGLDLSVDESFKDFNESDPSIGLSISNHSALEILDELEEDDEFLREDGDAVQSNRELAKHLMTPPKPSPGTYKRKTLKKSRKNKLRDAKKMGGSLSVIETLLGHSADDIEGSPLKKQSSLSDLGLSPSSSKRRNRKGRKQTLIEALKESNTLPPFNNSEDEDDLEDDIEVEVLVKDTPTRKKSRRKSVPVILETFDTDTASMRERRKSLSSSQYSEMPSSIRKGRSTVETSSRRSRRTVDGDGSSRRSRRTVDTGDGSSRRSRRTVDDSSRRSRRTIDDSSRRSKRTVDTGTGDGSSRHSRRTVDSDDGSSRKSKTLKNGRKKKSKKNKDSKKNKRKSTESMASNSTSVTADMDSSWTSIREDSQREEAPQEEQQQQTSSSQEVSPLRIEEEEGEYQLPEEEGEYELPLPEDDVGSGTLFASSLGNSLPTSSLGSCLGSSSSLHDRYESSVSTLDLSESEDEDEEEIAEEQKQELHKFMRTDSFGALNSLHHLRSDSDNDDDHILVDVKVDAKEEVARPPSRRSLLRESRRDSRRGSSCGAGKRDSGRGREEERSSKRGFSVSPERHLHETMMEREQVRPRLSCMKGSRGKLMSVKLKNPHVYFNECLVVTPIIPTYELASKKSDLWFRQKDFDKILNRSMAIALRVKEGKKTKKCVRGLEHFLKDKEERYAAWNAVLIEQEIQNLSGKHSDEKISQKYLEASTTCRTEAQQMAQSDYDAIVQYILEDTKQKKK